MLKILSPIDELLIHLMLEANYLHTTHYRLLHEVKVRKIKPGAPTSCESMVFDNSQFNIVVVL